MRVGTSAGLALLLVGGAAALAWLGMRGDGPAHVAEPVTAPVVKQKSAAIPSPRSFDCRVEPRETVAAGAVGNGVMDRVLVDVGVRVVDGQVLGAVTMPSAASAVARPTEVGTGTSDASLAQARREAAELQAAVPRLRTKANVAGAAFDKQELLNRAGVTPRLVYESALAERDRAASELAAAEEASRLADNAISKAEDLHRAEAQKVRERQQAARDAALAEIHAPSAGLVVERSVAPGDAVTDANRAALFRIAPRPESLRAEFSPLPAGTPVSIRVGSVLIGTTVSENGTYANFESRIAVIPPGSPCTVTIK